MSQFIVSARKYRPQRFEDVVGQQHVAQTLKNALATDHVAHAFLFCGPRGVGKTTCARILARLLNCENRTPQFEACNDCASCRAFNENASFNIIELDAASNNSVDHIRALVEQVRFQPQQGRYKVFIIDEVHMLSSSAFNAFLKTLEEPPPYAIFILATTEKHKIIPTILSRCQIFDFRRITVADMVLHLKGICAKEGIAAEEDALHIVAQKADGALRDALSIFDRITSFSGKRITYNDVIENLNVLDYDYYFQITDALLAEDLPAVLNLFDQILRKGFEPDVFVNGLADHLRNILVCKDESTLALLEAGESLRERYRKQAALAPASFLLTALNLANDCDINFKMARHKRLHVEIALIKMCHVRRAVPAALAAATGGVAQPGAPAPAAGMEKKTPDLNPAPPGASVNGGAAAASSLGGGREEAKVGNAQELSEDELNELRTSLQHGLKKAVSISLRLDAYEQAVAVEEAEKAALESRLTLENAADEWRIYCEQQDSPSLRQAMNSAELRVEDKTITASVGLALHRSALQAESNRLLDTLRVKLQDPQLKIRIEIDERRQPAPTETPRPARPMTAQERLQQMQQGNPLVHDLVQRFGLKVEE